MSTSHGGGGASESTWGDAQAGLVRVAAADRFKALSHTDRLRIVEVLAAGPKTVTQVAASAGRPLNTVSRHLRVLRDAEVVRCSKRGNTVLYVLSDRDVARLAALAYRGVGTRLQKVAAMAATGALPSSESEPRPRARARPDGDGAERLS